MISKFTAGQEFETTVVAVSKDFIFINLNEKSEGVLNKSELIDENGICSVKAGDSIKVYFLGEKNGEMNFTTRLAGQSADSASLETAFKNHIPVEGKVESEIKGGFSVLIGGIKTFCPYSQMGFKNKEEPSTYVGKNLIFIIQEYKENGKNIIVSNRLAMQEKYNNKLENVKNNLSVGQTVSGTVSELKDFGAFIDINGFSVLLPISEISFDRITNINDVLKIGDTVTAKVLNADWERERISVSIKALLSNPWDNISSKYKIGQKLDGKISRVTDYGLFVALEPGIDGLVHISTLKNAEKNTNIKKLYKAGTEISVQIDRIDAGTKRISLIPATSAEQDETAAKYLNSQKDNDTYNPFAALLKK